MMHTMKMKKQISHKSVLETAAVLSFSFFPYDKGTPDNPTGYIDREMVPQFNTVFI
jgi:hypothetical protein